MFGATAVVAVDGVAVWQMAQPQADRQEMVVLLDRIKEASGFRAIAIVGAVALLAGMLVLAYGLFRTRAAQPWIAVGAAAAAIVLFTAQVADSRAVLVGAFALYLAALGALGSRTLRLSDDEWARAPTDEESAPAPGLAG